MSDEFDRNYEATQDRRNQLREHGRAEAVSPAEVSGAYGLVIHRGAKVPYPVQIEGVGEKVLISLTPQGAVDLMVALLRIM